VRTDRRKLRRAGATGEDVAGRGRHGCGSPGNRSR
jgi:hypothetical protein